MTTVRWTCLLLASLGAARAGMPVGYVLAPRVVMADPWPDARFDAALAGGSEFTTRFDAEFAGERVEPGPARLISPDERVVLVVPRITAARVTHTVQADAIHTFDAIVAGDVSVLDPWTGATLFAATRMISGEARLGTSALGNTDSAIRAAFRDAFRRWAEVSVKELRQKLAPFVLDAATVEVTNNRGMTGGVWPYGAARGVRTGAVVAGDSGRFARVVQVEPGYAVIEDAAGPQRRIPAGERYRLTIMDKPSERPEPRVALLWIGAGPDPPPGVEAKAVGAAGLSGLFGSYLSKGGGLLVLPQKDGAGAGEIVRFRDYVARHSELVKQASLTLHAGSVARAASDFPEHEVELGILERYYGRRVLPDGAEEHYQRVTLAAAIRNRTGFGSHVLYPQVRLVRHTEELARVTKPGIRESEPSAAWFTLLRNAAIRLSGAVGPDLARAAPGGEAAWKQGVAAGSGAVSWQAGAPDPGTPLEWLRPSGEVRDGGGGVRPFNRRMPPSRGFLTADLLAAERLQPGDILRFRSGIQSDPIVALETEVPGDTPAWAPPKEWLSRLAGDALSRALAVSVVPIGSSGPEVRRFVVNVSALSGPAPDGGRPFSGQWRVRLTGTAFKTGLQVDTRVSPAAGRAPLEPPDIAGWSLQYTVECLQKLALAAKAKGATEALRAP